MRTLNAALGLACLASALSGTGDRRHGARTPEVLESRVDADRDGFAEALQVIMILPHREDRMPRVLVELCTRNSLPLSGIALGAPPGVDVWTLSSFPTVPIHRTRHGSDSLIVWFDGEKIRESGLDGPWIVRLNLFSRFESTFTGTLEAPIAGGPVGEFGWLPARIEEMQVGPQTAGKQHATVRILVEHDLDLQLHVLFERGSGARAPLILAVPPGLGARSVSFAIPAADSAAVAIPGEVARIWLDAPGSPWVERSRWTELWMRWRANRPGFVQEKELVEPKSVD